jgi:RecA/RadA recombinase
MTLLGLPIPKGLVHVMGLAGSGKTIFAARLAVEASRTGGVEWICNDNKSSVLRYLRSTAEAYQGLLERIYVTFTKNSAEALTAISSLPENLAAEDSLVVIDPITHTLDLGNVDSPMWGRELIEDVMPTLASLAKDKGIPILLISQCRYIPDLGVAPIHNATIKKWVDLEILVKRSYGESQSHMEAVTASGMSSTLGTTRLRNSSIVEFHRCLSSTRFSEVSDNVW